MYEWNSMHGAGLAISAKANVGEAEVKPRSGGRSQNGQPVEYGKALFVIG
jgi:hypothetical protein